MQSRQATPQLKRPLRSIFRFLSHQGRLRDANPQLVRTVEFRQKTSNSSFQTIEDYDLRHLSNLRKFVVRGNQLLTGLPEWLGELPALQELDLAENGICTLPAALGRLQTVVTLDLRCEKCWRRIGQSFVAATTSYLFISLQPQRIL